MPAHFWQTVVDYKDYDMMWCGVKSISVLKFSSLKTELSKKGIKRYIKGL